MADHYDPDDEDTFEIAPNNNLSHLAEEKFLIDGFLKKKSPKGLLKVWQERWFRLTTRGLYYFKKRDSKDAQAHVPMYAIAAIICDPSSFKKKGFRFDITLAEHYGGRVFSVVARTEAECLDWVEKLKNAKAEYEDHVTHFTKHVGVPDENAAGKTKIWKLAAGNTNNAQVGAASAITDVETEATSHVIFKDLKIVADQSLSDFGSVFIIGGNDYPVNHRSFILHCIGKEQLHYVAGKQAIQELGEICNFPTFARQLHVGETGDAVFAIYHPPFRMQSDSLFAWLEYLKVFPEDTVMHLASQLLLALEFLHQRDVVFVNLCPESLFFDIDGNLRILDTVLTLPPSMVPVMSVEYTCPENIKLAGSEGKIACDFWRFGVLLYELSVGSLPFESFIGNGEDIDDNEHRNFILDQIATLDICNVEFPPEVSPELRDLICKLLVVEPSQRLNVEQIKSHPFFAGVPSWDINDILASPKPDWIIESIVEPMLGDPQTPINLTPEPEEVTTYRLQVHVKSVRGLPKELTSRLYCTLNVEGDVQKTKVLTQDNVNMEINERFKFDLLTGGNLPDSSDVVIELISKKLEQEGRSVVGTVSFPLNEIRVHHYMTESMTVLSPDALPIGELLVTFRWIEEVGHPSKYLSRIADGKKSFTETFLKLAPTPPAKMWSMIVDPSIQASVSQSNDAEATTAAQPQTQQNSANPPTPMATLSKTNNMTMTTTTRKSPFIDADLEQHEQAEVFSPASPTSANQATSRTSINQLTTSVSSSRISNTTILEPSVVVQPQPVEEPKVEPVKLDPEANPANWKTATDAQSGDLYYYNKVTKRTSWTAPPCIADQG